MNDQQMERLLALLGEIASSLAEINRRLAPEAPNYRRSLDEFGAFDWSSINAQVARRDEFGPSQVEWMDNIYTRRSPENKFDVAIWFSRPDGKDADGNNKYARLITFRKYGDAEPISRAAEKAVATPVAAATRPATPAPGQITPVPSPVAPAPPPSDMSAASDVDRAWHDLPSASESLQPPPLQSKIGNGSPPPISNGARPPSPGTPGEGSGVGAVHQAALLCPTCGRTWQQDNPACANHVRPRIPGEPAAAPKPKRQATLPAGKLGGEFRAWAGEFARAHPHYQISRTGDTDMYHILMTVAALGYDHVDAGNITNVQQSLEQHAAQKEPIP